MLGRTPQRLSTIVLAFAIFAFAVPTRAGSQTLPTLRIAASVSDAFAEGSYAVDMGFFKKAGLNVDLQLFANGTAALARGTVDAAVIPEPSLTDARDKGLVRDFGKVYDAISTQFMNGAWFTTLSFAQKNPDVVKRFQAAIYDAGRWANKNHDRSAEILAKHSKINVQTARTMTRSLYSDSLTAQSVQPALDAAFKYGLLQRPVNAGDMIFHTPDGVR